MYNIVLLGIDVSKTIDNKPYLTGDTFTINNNTFEKLFNVKGLSLMYVDYKLIKNLL